MPNFSSFLRAKITGRILSIKVHKFGVRAYLLGRHHPFVPQLCPIQSRGGLDENASTYILSYIPLVCMCFPSYASSPQALNGFSSLIRIHHTGHISGRMDCVKGQNDYGVDSGQRHVSDARTRHLFSQLRQTSALNQDQRRLPNQRETALFQDARRSDCR